MLSRTSKSPRKAPPLIPYNKSVKLMKSFAKFYTASLWLYSSMSVLYCFCIWAFCIACVCHFYCLLIFSTIAFFYWVSFHQLFLKFLLLLIAFLLSVFVLLLLLIDFINHLWTICFYLSFFTYCLVNFHALKYFYLFLTSSWAHIWKCLSFAFFQ